MNNLPKYVSREPDRHGNIRFYYRRNGRRVRLHAEPGTKQFADTLKQIERGIIPDRALPRRAKSLQLGGDITEHCPIVYFISHGNKRVKIGTTGSLKSRYAAIRAGTPGNSKILYLTPGDYRLERELHQRFMKDRVNGEWFIYSKGIRDWIAADQERRWNECDTAPEGLTKTIVTPADETLK